MWRISDVKNGGRIAFKRNYWKSVFIAAFFVLIAGSGSFVSSSISDFPSAFINNQNTNYDNNEDEEKWIDIEPTTDNVEVVGNSEKNETLQMGIIITAIVIIAIVVVILVFAIQMLMYAFIYGPFDVGIKRFFLFNLMRDSQAKELVYAFDNGYKNISSIMFSRYLYTFFWTLLFVIPGIIKMYEYRMIPYILAENPNVSKDEAFAISKSMMNGNKWNAFLLDLSFIGWQILSLITFGMLGIFYVDPYKMSTDANLYATIKYGNVQG